MPQVPKPLRLIHFWVIPFSPFPALPTLASSFFLSLAMKERRSTCDSSSKYIYGDRRSHSTRKPALNPTFRHIPRPATGQYSGALSF